MSFHIMKSSKFIYETIDLISLLSAHEISKCPANPQLSYLLMMYLVFYIMAEGLFSSLKLYLFLYHLCIAFAGVSVLQF